jgi:hypothetical protein
MKPLHILQSVVYLLISYTYSFSPHQNIKLKEAKEVFNNFIPNAKKNIYNTIKIVELI